MRTINLTELQALIDSYEPRSYVEPGGEFEGHLPRVISTGLFVRWSTTPEADCRRGYSTNWQTGETHLGLSANELVSDSDRPLMDRVMEYSFLPGRPWVVEGWLTGRGADNEPLIDEPKAIAYIDLD